MADVWVGDQSSAAYSLCHIPNTNRLHAAQGIGAAVALGMARNGANVILAGGWARAGGLLGGKVLCCMLSLLPRLGCTAMETAGAM